MIKVVCTLRKMGHKQIIKVSWGLIKNYLYSPTLDVFLLVSNGNYMISLCWPRSNQGLQVIILLMVLMSCNMVIYLLARTTYSCIWAQILQMITTPSCLRTSWGHLLQKLSTRGMLILYIFGIRFISHISFFHNTSLLVCLIHV